MHFLRPWIFVFVLLAGCSRVDFDDIGLHEPIVKGGQREIDQGHVVDVTWLPGIWLAGHHSTHGAVFRNLGEADIGDRVCAYSKCFIVFNIIVVSESYQVTGALAPLVMQTSWFGRILLVLAH